MKGSLKIAQLYPLGCSTLEQAQLSRLASTKYDENGLQTRCKFACRILEQRII
jgi:hypothetical protein